MFLWMRNPMITLKIPYDSWLTQNSKWLPSIPAEITLISQWAQILAIYRTCTSQERTEAMLFYHWDLSQHEKSMPPPLNWMDYLYSAIFKMAASEEKLRFCLLLFCRL